ncbi:hypothetical protein GEMRC1_005987 [Eukaryota sp. GEM-RC1]
MKCYCYGRQGEGYIAAAVDSMGRFTRARDQCPSWSFVPLSVNRIGKFVLTFFDDGKAVELRLANSFSLLGVSKTGFSCNAITEVRDSEYSPLDELFCVSGGGVFKVTPLSWSKLVEQQLSVKEYEKALEVVELMKAEKQENSDELYLSVCRDYGFELFKNSEFSKCFTYLVKGLAEVTKVLSFSQI